MVPSREEMYKARELIKKFREMGLTILKYDDQGSAGAFGKWSRENREKLNELGVELNFGATRLVFKCADLPNWVLKTDRYIDQPLCAIEVQIYSDAVRAGLGKYFAPCYAVEGFNNWSIMELCDADENMVVDQIVEGAEERGFEYFNEYMDVGDDEEYDWDGIRDYIDDMNDEERLTCLYGDCHDLWRFIRQKAHETSSNSDLHSGNFGVNDEGDVVIIDYSGFGGQYGIN